MSEVQKKTCHARLPAGRKSVVVMVEPVDFFCNEATCADNYFQDKDYSSVSGNTAISEHRGVVSSLVARDVATFVYRLSDEERLGEEEIADSGSVLEQDEQLKQLSSKPDAIFPNNSISFHEISKSLTNEIFAKVGVDIPENAFDATAVVLYPMCPGRRNEIPRTLLDKVKAEALVVVTPRFLGLNKGARDLDVLTNWGLRYEAKQIRGEDDEPLQVKMSKRPATVLVDLRSFQDVELLALGQKGSSEAKLWWALEGTGSLNFSAKCDTVFATASQRCHPIPFSLLCEALGITRERRFLVASAVDTSKRCIYHTNVVGWVGDGGLCGWCSDSLVFDVVREQSGEPNTFTSQKAFEEELSQNYGDTFFKLSYSDLQGFAGNAMYLRSRDGVSYLAMSKTAANSLGDEMLAKMNAALANLSLPDSDQIQAKHAQLSDAPAMLYPQYPHIIACPVPTIERLGGGSVRCLLAASLSLTAEGHAALSRLVAPPSKISV